MSTLTRTRKFSPHAQVEAALASGKMVWIGDLLTPAPTPKRTPAEIKTHVATVRAAMIAETTPAPTPTQEIPADVFSASGAQLRAWAYTPTGRDRRGGEAARAEIARRAAKRAAKRAAR